MDTNTILGIVKSHKGQHINATFRSIGKPSAKWKGTKLEKITTGAFRVGIDFANLSEVKEGIASGERGEVEGLPWGTWTEFPYLISHKGKNYFRFYPSTGGFIQKPVVNHFVNGEQVDKDTYYSYQTGTSSPSKDKQCFVVESSNILSVGGQND